MVEPNYLNIYMCFHYTLANFYFNSESTVFLSTPLTPSIYKSRDSLDPPLTDMQYNIYCRKSFNNILTLMLASSA